MRKQSFVVFVIVFVLLVTVALATRGQKSGFLKQWLPAMHGPARGH